MAVIGLWNFLRGYVKLSIQGYGLEKFVNLCIAQGFYLWGIKRRGNRLILCMGVESFKRIRPIARKTDCQVRIVDKRGFPFLAYRLQRRKMLVMGACAFCVGLYVLSAFVWVVKFTAPEKTDLTALQQTVADLGVKPGVLKSRIARNEVEREILIRHPELSWVGMHIIGSQVLIEVRPKIKPPALPAETPCDIVAAKDGLITRLVVYTGQPQVKEKDTVKQGDILISGIIYPPVPPPNPNDQKPQPPPPPAAYVHASGLVEARVWYEAVVEVPVRREEKIRTGRLVKTTTIRYNGKDQVILGPDVPFALFETEVYTQKLSEWRNLKIPVEIVKTTYYELTVDKRVLGQEGAKQEGIRLAREELKKQISAEAKVTQEKVEILKPMRPGTVRVQLIVETLENIAQEVKLEKP